MRRWERALSLSLDDLDGAAAGRVQHAWAQLRAREAYRAYFAKGRT